MTKGLKNRLLNFRKYLKGRVSPYDETETSMREEHGKKPAGRIQKRLSGEKRERITNKTEKTQSQTGPPFKRK